MNDKIIHASDDLNIVIERENVREVWVTISKGRLFIEFPLDSESAREFAAHILTLLDRGAS